jgi:hypothetical protein
MKNLIVFVLMLTLFSSCKKNEEIEVKNPWKLELSKNTHTSIKDIFDDKKLDLQEIIMDKDKEFAKEVFIDLANKIGSYVKDTEGIDLTNDYIDDPEGVIMVGVFLGLHEKYNQRTKPTTTNDLTIRKDIDDFGCFLTAVGTLIGITEIQSIYESIVAGATKRTVIGALKLIGRRVAGVITVGIMIYEVGDCLEWWD